MQLTTVSILGLAQEVFGALIEAMRVAWFEDFNQAYPGDDPYDHNAFRVRYSDHHPVRFRLQIGDDDD